MKQKAYFPELESLRGIAALMICFEHIDYWCVYKQNTFIPNLYLFVDFFFVLSGFVITLNFSQKITDGTSYKGYLIKRFFRLYPLFLTTSIPYFATSILKTYYHFTVFQTSNYFKLPDFFAYLTLTFKWGFVDDLIFNQPTWSISVELFLYILCGLVFMLSKSKKVNIALSVVLCIASFAILAWHDHALIDSGRLAVLRGILSFFMGVIICYLLNPNQERIAPSGSSAFARMNYFMLTVILFATAFLLIGSYPILTFVFPLLWTLVIYLMVDQKLPAFISWFLNLRFMLFLGTISYSIYLTNPMMTFVTEKIFKKARMESSYGISIAGSVTLFTLIIVVSWFTYHYIEIPGKALSKRFTKPSASDEAATIAERK